MRCYYAKISQRRSPRDRLGGAFIVDFAVVQLQRLALTPAQLASPQISLTAAQQHYLHRVLRLQAGDRVVVMDGCGQSWVAQLQAGDRPLVLLEQLPPATELPVAIALVAALPKGNGFDEVVRQVTELGVQRIIPVLSDRTLLQPSANKVERWRRIATEAAEQSERQVIPTIEEPIAFQQHVQSWSAPACPTSQRGYLCVARREVPHLLTHLRADPPAAGSELYLAIGPEGGWTPAEVEAAIAAGYFPVSLGDRILRAVTAAVVAMAIGVAGLDG